MRIDQIFCHYKSTLAGRTLAFFAWLLMIVLLLLGGLVGVAADSIPLGSLLCIPAIAVYLLLQALAAKMEEKHDKKLQVAQASSMGQNPPAQQTSAKPIAAHAYDSNGKKREIEKCMNVLHTNLSYQQSITVQFTFPGTQNIALLTAAPDTKDHAYLQLITKVYRDGSDLCLMNFMEHRTLEEMRAYLADKSHAAVLLESFQHLSDQLDDRI